MKRLAGNRAYYRRRGRVHSAGRVRGHTLVELLVACMLAAIVALIAGRLLFDGMESWRVQADMDTAKRQSVQTLHALCDDVLAQARVPESQALVDAFSFDEDNARLRLMLSGEGFSLRAVCWYVEGDGAGLWTLYRVEADEAASAAALPANAAELLIAAATAEPEGDAARDLNAQRRRMCTGLVSLNLEMPEGGTVRQLRLVNVSPEGQARLREGETMPELPERIFRRAAMPCAQAY